MVYTDQPVLSIYVQAVAAVDGWLALSKRDNPDKPHLIDRPSQIELATLLEMRPTLRRAAGPFDENGKSITFDLKLMDSGVFRGLSSDLWYPRQKQRHATRYDRSDRGARKKLRVDRPEHWGPLFTTDNPQLRIEFR
jgi:hypothetical protein